MTVINKKGGTMELKLLFTPLILFSILYMNSCATLTLYYGEYNIELKKVERPVKAKKRYGEQKISILKEEDINNYNFEDEEEGINKYYFEDELIRVIWIPLSSKLAFLMENKTNHSIRIIWDEASFIDENGISHRIAHSGIKYSEIGNPKPPTVVARKAKIRDFVIATDNILYQEGFYVYKVYSPGFFYEKPIFIYTHNNLYELELVMRSNVGKTIQVLLPLKIEDIINDYIFVFEVKSYDLKGEYKVK